ncbi:MAG TPA: rhomboid family intramembrane serine protease [Kofleriaceae bacterium]|nr:rhomboid family intramembrane serine protease [Kofleriaceae bacterium]
MRPWWPRLGSKLVSQWIVATVVVSLVAAIGSPSVPLALALVPSKILHGQVWRLVTWPFVHASPINLVFTCVAIYKFGGELAPRWGDRRLRRFALEVAIGAGVATCLLALVTGYGDLHRFGGLAMIDALVIAWARQYPRAVLVLYGVVELSGQRLVLLTVAVATVYALYYGPVFMAPELAACGVAALYPRAWLAR